MGLSDEGIVRSRPSRKREREVVHAREPHQTAWRLGFLSIFYSVLLGRLFLFAEWSQCAKVGAKKRHKSNDCLFLVQTHAKKKSREGAVKKGENSAIIATGGDLLEPTEKP